MPKKPPRDSARVRTAPTNGQILDHLRRAHEGGDRTAARLALEHCALASLVMPEWLAAIVSKAIRISSRGVPDDVLGFGNEKILPVWRRAHLRGRDAAIRHTFNSVLPWDQRSRRVTATEYETAVARAHGLSIKAVQKIRYARISPTRKVKK